MKFIKNPNLPREKVKSVLADHRAESVRKTLEALGITVYLTPKINIAYAAVSGHPDMAFHQLDENTAVVAPEAYEYYSRLFGKKRIIKGSSAVGEKYPGDIAYNSARIGRVAFHNAKFTDKCICEYYKSNGIKLINVKQGYSKCSICVISEHALITEDKAIARAAAENGIDPLLIRPGGVKLSGFPYGFIGGASGLVSENEIFFSGDISQHPDFNALKGFCGKHNVKIIASPGAVGDIGSIIPLE